VAPGHSLDISNGDDSLWERKAPARPVRVDKLEAKLNRTGGLQVQWEGARDAVEYWLRWSRDGKQWQSMATGLIEPKLRVDAGQLPSGEVMLQVVAHDGFYSSASKLLKLTLPEKAPHITIHHPEDGFTYVEGQTLRLWASVSSGDGRDDEKRSSTWMLGRKPIGEGLEAWITLPAGEHKLTLTVEDASGSHDASVRVTVRAADSC
jgi:hypothetical protein